jgi:hypothetical protein
VRIFHTGSGERVVSVRSIPDYGNGNGNGNGDGDEGEHGGDDGEAAAD